MFSFRKACLIVCFHFDIKIYVQKDTHFILIVIFIVKPNILKEEINSNAKEEKKIRWDLNPR